MPKIYNMTDKFQNKYRISSARLQGWDYGKNAPYFITICTQNHQPYFGKITNGEMYLSEIGKIAATEWTNTPEIRPDMNLELGEYVVMPNHFHAIIIIGKNEFNKDAMHCISTTDDRYKNSFTPQSKNLASIIRGFKSSVTKNARQIQPNFAWQSRFYEHIIRNEESFHTISEYVRNNPLNWPNDKLYSQW